MRLIIFSIFLLSYICVKGQDTLYKLENDIVYTFNQDIYSQSKCKLDLYYPVDKKDFVTLIWFHGGGLTSGNKEIPNYLKNRDLAIIGVGYRLAPQVSVTDILEDSADAVKWVFDNISRFGGNKSKVVIGGMSAGAYISLMLALNEEYRRQRDLNANDLLGIIFFSAQTITHFTARAQNGIEGLQPLVDHLSPLYWARKDIPNTLLITGDRELEMMGRYEENAYLWRMLKLHGNENVELLELDGYGHDMSYPAYPLLLNSIKKWNKNKP